MDDARLPGDPPLEVTLRRSARARRMSLRISRFDGRVTLTLPLHAPRSEGLAFLRDKESWIREHLRARPAELRVGIGAEIPVEGVVLRLVPGTGHAAVRRGPGRLEVPAAQAGARVRAYLKTLARERLSAAVTRHADHLGAVPGRLTLRDTRSRWGSCSSRGDLMFSWRLVMAPPAVLDYVAAHEVAHLKEMNHSPAFWALVARLCPDHAEHRIWLRENGAGLYRIRFGD
ncbi:M48 family metallopeptidase [Rhodovulum imhoffii]|nr:SprT family zinc-dependent metalloprotease [Rhodovulum imhoffii]MBK5933277.1 zinc metalloprotease [Rhodovulum imhoffii]